MNKSPQYNKQTESEASLKLRKYVFTKTGKVTVTTAFIFENK